MRKEQFFRKIESSWQFHYLKEMVECPIEEYKRKYDYRLHLHRDWYTQSRYHYLFDKLTRQIRLENEHTFEYGIWGRVRIRVFGGVDRGYMRCEPYLRFSLDFLDLRRRPTAIDNLPFPENVDVNRPQKWVKKLLQTRLIEEGYFAELQLRRDLKKEEISKRALPLMNYKQPTAYCHDKAIKWIKKKFNIDSFVSVEKTVSIVNKIGKQTEKKTIAAYDFSWADSFDGDIDELENEFYGQLEKNVIYV